MRVPHKWSRRVKAGHACRHTGHAKEGGPKAHNFVVDWRGWRRGRGTSASHHYVGDNKKKNSCTAAVGAYMHYVCRGKHASGSSTRETRRSEVAILSSAYMGSGQKRSKRQTKMAGKVYSSTCLYLMERRLAS